MKNTKIPKSKPEVSFWTAVWFIVKISLISFGGGNAIFPIIKNQAVDKYHWITDAEIEDIIVITNSIPGPSTVEAMSYICIKILGSKWKGLMATFIGLLPHVLIFFALFMLGTAFLPTQYLNVVYIAVIPVIIVMLLGLSMRYFRNLNVELSYPLFFGYFIFSVAFNLFIPSPYNIPIILICAVILIGILFEVWKTHWYKKHPPVSVQKPRIKVGLESKNPEYKVLLKKSKAKDGSKAWLLEVFDHLDLDDIDTKYKIFWSADGIFFRPKWGFVFKEVVND